MKRAEMSAYQQKAKEKFEELGIPVNDVSRIEIADFGLGEFEKIGLILIVKVNSDLYCSKWLLLMPGQHCPSHHHNEKTETFFILKGTVKMDLDGKVITLKPGDDITLKPGQAHSFWSDEWALIEEVSTHDEDYDSIFRDERIVRTPEIEE